LAWLVIRIQSNMIRVLLDLLTNDVAKHGSLEFDSERYFTALL
jgi:hypothetical protein